MKAIGSRLRAAREMAGLSQAQVAKKLELHRPSVSEMEAGRRKVTADELSRLAKIYAVSISWLACSEEENSRPEMDRIRLAARQLEKLKPADIDGLLQLLRALRSAEDNER